MVENVAVVDYLGGAICHPHPGIGLMDAHIAVWIELGEKVKSKSHTANAHLGGITILCMIEYYHCGNCVSGIRC
jgi:hypothetical protein